ncbi:MAG: LysM peptidoglycan-binding domain-containing protein [Planctomycetes bacterium]|nr:LysM peptidoglycan-binding domain-containing protein [Planctomycetota bacterium]
MSTLEKLLVLGVLVLVGVILAISLFWNRPDLNNTNRTNNAGLIGSAPQLPVPPALSTNQSTDGANPSSNINNGGGASRPAESDIRANEGTLIAAASKPAGDRNVMLSNAVPSAFVTPSASPNFYVYKVQKNDTPRSVSMKLTGTESNAGAIDRAVEGHALVPGKEILVPAEVFNNVKNPATGDELAKNSVETLKTGINTKKASTVAHDSKSATAETKDSKDAGAADGTTYTVKSGDSLRRIARVMLKDERRWKEIQQLNQMKNDIVREGQKIKLPAANR